VSSLISAAVGRGNRAATATVFLEPPRFFARPAVRDLSRFGERTGFRGLAVFRELAVFAERVAFGKLRVFAE